MTIQFKTHKIIRNCNKNYKDYHDYKPFLKVDFVGRCAYCNMNDEWLLPLPYQIDHFIPRVAFEKAGRKDLDTDYKNLMYSCPICNRLKGGVFSGDVPATEIKNPHFYNPVDKDYNTLFYRDEKGHIMSDDELGQRMIKQLQLYRPTKQMAWFLDELKEVRDMIAVRTKQEQDSEKRERLNLAKTNLESALYRKHSYFVHSYVIEKG